MRVFKCVAALLAAWGNASIFSPASLVWAQAQKAGVYLELAELQPASPQKIAPNLCSLGRLKPNLREAWLFLEKLGWWQCFINKWAVGNLNNTFYCLQLQSSPAATNDSNQYLQQGINYFSSTSSGDSRSSGELCCQRSTCLDQWVSPI